jgi:hypothetical protein
MAGNPMADPGDEGLEKVRLSFPDEMVRAVGVSHYQDALRRIAGPGEGPVRRSVEATLAPEPTNPYDENAVMVRVEGELVGYLSREDAVRYGAAVRLLRDHRLLLACDAMVAGKGPAAGTANLGVFLELPRAPEAALEAQSLVGG